MGMGTDADVYRTVLKKTVSSVEALHDHVISSTDGVVRYWASFPLRVRRQAREGRERRSDVQQCRKSLYTRRFSIRSSIQHRYTDIVFVGKKVVRMITVFTQFFTVIAAKRDDSVTA